ncbi:MAG: UDP-glucose 4-epimerase GalE [Patescibacteria group bacterium]
MSKILVTGAGGYIGSVTSKLLLENGYSVVALDNFSRGYHEPLELLKSQYSNKISIHTGDLLVDGGKEVLEKEKDIEAVIHFAALLNVGESWKIPHKYYTNNIGGTTRLTQELIDHGVRYFIFSSSCTVYGNAQYSPIDENHPIAEPVTPYGFSKLVCEKILSWHDKVDALKSVSLRYFNVCGATDDGTIGDSKRPSFHLMQNAVRGALGIAPFELNYANVKTPDGSPIRDYVNVVDLADAHVKALKWILENKKTNVFNLGTGDGNSVLEIIEAVKKYTGKTFEVGVSADRRSGEADKMIADNRKAKEILGWEPKHSLEQSVESLIKWYTKHPGGWGR